MFKKNILNFFFLFLFLLLIGGSVFSVIWNFKLKTNTKIEKQNNEIMPIKESGINEKTKNTTSFMDFTKDLFSNLNKVLNKSIILDKSYENIKKYEEEHFKFDKKKFEKEIIKIISQKIFKFNLKIIFNYFNNDKVVKVRIINKENENEQVSKNFRISID